MIIHRTGKNRISIFLFISVLSIFSIRVHGQSSEQGSVPTATSLNINQNYPFGYPGLHAVKAAVRWYTDSLFQQQGPEGLPFDSIYQFYAAFADVTPLSAIRIKHALWIPIGEREKTDQYFDTTASRTSAAAIYRLPDIGSKQLFITIQQSTTLNYGLYSNLAIVDTISGDGSAYPVFHIYGGDQNITYRFFYMEKRKIRIFEGYCYDDGCNLRPSHVLRISKKGAVVIRSI